jgi:hypothetical protein
MNKERMDEEQMDEEPVMIDRFDQMKGGCSRRDEVDSLPQIVTNDIQHQEDIGALRQRTPYSKTRRRRVKNSEPKFLLSLPIIQNADIDDWPAGYDRFQALMNKLNGATTKVESHNNKVDDLKQTMTTKIIDRTELEEFRSLH